MRISDWSSDVCSSDDEFLLPPLEEKEVVGVEEAEVAGAEPAVLGEGLAVGHRVVAVAGADVRAAKLDLAHAGRAGPGDPQLAALERLALAAEDRKGTRLNSST